ncbi:MAG: hypothetical protein A4E45_00744 [Methanosaeta sp. PtaB.Bin039]|nr:MAG: hypothetical protein A4E45_00744 [Methanosaeta sp. PtaB.Bin039]OPY46006.1 MAG: hypothetical protein A4E47_00761 [Methanosaeta sp. PtaU1.Bin028]HOT07336.1 PGF-CTERM sorting domain-containing protein [Methanotrichaceae archaeon]HQF17324.1 PGF-CTERM sorting domain-containing protein [Methanotrichaceae archaeon]HQI91930.1 PGF-CTERM sorting domain-containing protein [Methanotrichaceae archaeon]
MFKVRSSLRALFRDDGGMGGFVSPSSYEIGWMLPWIFREGQGNRFDRETNGNVGGISLKSMSILAVLVLSVLALSTMAVASEESVAKVAGAVAEVKEEAAGAAEAVGAAASNATETVKEEAASVAEEAKEEAAKTTEEAKETVSEAAESAKEKVNETIPAEAKGTPGFEAVFAIAGLLSVAYMVLGRRN